MAELADLFKIPKLTQRANYFYLIRALRFVWRTSRALTILTLLTNTISALFPAANLYVMKFVIDSITTLLSSQTRGPELSNIHVLIIILIGLWILSHFINVFQTSISSLFELRVDQNTQLAIMRKCSELDIAFFENPTYLNMLQNARVGASGNIFYVIQLFFSFIQTIITLVSFIAILFQLHWGTMLVLIISLIPQIISNRYLAKRRWEITTGLAESRRMSGYYSGVVTQRGVAKEIRLFGLFKHFFDRFKFFVNKFIQIEKNFIRKQAIIGFFVNLVSIAGSAAVWIFIIWRAVNGMISIGDIVLFTGAVSSFRGGLTTLFSFAGQFLRNALFLQHFFSLLDLKPTSVNGALQGPSYAPAQRSGNRKPPIVLKKGIEFKNVSFKYPATNRLVLNNVSFFLPHKESIALVGENGAGKTTLIKLLVRLYDPIDGQILIDDEDIKEFDLERLHRMFSVIFQDYTRYPLTVRENIGFGNIEKIDDITLVEKASKKAGAHKFIECYPDKYETYIGRIFLKSNIDPSVGEWQKICLARALMREEAPVLILDEPTAALDVFAEYELYRSFSKMMIDRLTIIISHRFSTVRAAHHILVLHEGKLIEEGSHEELIKRDTLYKEMYNIQAERYK